MIQSGRVESEPIFRDDFESVLGFENRLERTYFVLGAQVLLCPEVLDGFLLVPPRIHPPGCLSSFLQYPNAP